MLALLLLGDGRLPTGGHAHSAGVESAVADGRVHDLESLRAYLVGRLHTTALTEAALAAAAVVHLGRDHTCGPLLDAEADARLPVPALRAASRRLGRQLVRTASRCWPDPVFAAIGEDPHQPVALGAAGLAVGAAPADVAALAVHHAVSAPAGAALRLLGLDPFAVAALTADLAVEGAHVVADAVACAGGPLADLPARTGPLVEIAAVSHGDLPTRLFAT